MCTTSRKRWLRAASVFPPPAIVSYRGIAAIMLIDSTSPECAAGNIFLMDGASHFVIIFTRDTAWNGGKALRCHRNEIRARVPCRWFIPPARREIYYSRALSASRLFFNRATESQGISLPLPSSSSHCVPLPHARLKAQLCVHFFQRNGKVEKPLGIFLRFYEIFCVRYFIRGYD